MDWNTRAETLGAATIAAVDALAPRLETQRLYAICLQTAEDGMSVGLCANTEEGYVAKRASEAELEDMTPDYAAYLRWAPAEWRYENVDGDHFTALNRDLTTASLHAGEGFDRHFDQLIETMIDALARLRAERTLEGVTLFVTISDSEAAEAVERRSVERLNPPRLASEFGRPLDEAPLR